jgi:hypothetical protein
MFSVCKHCYLSVIQNMGCITVTSVHGLPWYINQSNFLINLLLKGINNIQYFYELLIFVRHNVKIVHLESDRKT